MMWKDDARKIITVAAGGV